MTNVHVGPFSVTAELEDFGVRVSVALDFKVLKFDWHANLSASNPSVTFSTGDHLKFSASITVAIDDSTGHLKASAEVSFPVYDPPFSVHEKHEHFSVSVKVLPAGGLCQLAQGVTKEGLSWLHKNYPGHVPSCKDLAMFRKHATPEILHALVEYKDVKGNGVTLVDAIAHAANGLPNEKKSKVLHVAPKDLEKILSIVVTNPKVNAAFPGLAGKFGLKQSEAADAEDMPQGNAFKLVEEIAIDAGATVGIEVGVATAIGIIVSAIVAIAGAGTIAFAGLSTAIIVGLVLFLIVLLFAGVVIFPLLAIVAAVVLGLIEFKVIKDAEPYEGLLAR